MQQCVEAIFLLKIHKMLNLEYNLDLLKDCLDGRNMLCSVTLTHISTIYIWGY